MHREVDVAKSILRHDGCSCSIGDSRKIHALRLARGHSRLSCTVTPKAAAVYNGILYQQLPTMTSLESVQTRRMKVYRLVPLSPDLQPFMMSSAQSFKHYNPPACLCYRCVNLLPQESSLLPVVCPGAELYNRGMRVHTVIRYRFQVGCRKELTRRILWTLPWRTAGIRGIPTQIL
jgi:hypothetical protein